MRIGSLEMPLYTTPHEYVFGLGPQGLATLGTGLDALLIVPTGMYSHR